MNIPSFSPTSPSSIPDHSLIRHKIGTVILAVSGVLGSGCASTGVMFPPECHTTRTFTRTPNGETERTYERCEQIYYDNGSRCRQIITTQWVNGETIRLGERTYCEPLFRRY